MEAGEDSDQGWATQSEKLGLEVEGGPLAHIHRKGSELRGEERRRKLLCFPALGFLSFSYLYTGDNNVPLMGLRSCTCGFSPTNWHIGITIKQLLNSKEWDSEPSESLSRNRK